MEHLPGNVASYMILRALIQDGASGKCQDLSEGHGG